MKTRKKILQWVTVFMLTMITGGLISWDINDDNEEVKRTKSPTEIPKK